MGIIVQIVLMEAPIYGFLCGQFQYLYFNTVDSFVDQCAVQFSITSMTWAASQINPLTLTAKSWTNVGTPARLCESGLSLRPAWIVLSRSPGCFLQWSFVLQLLNWLVRDPAARFFSKMLKGYWAHVFTLPSSKMVGASSVDTESVPPVDISIAGLQFQCTLVMSGLLKLGSLFDQTNEDFEYMYCCKKSTFQLKFIELSHSFENLSCPWVAARKGMGSLYKWRPSHTLKVIESFQAMIPVSSVGLQSPSNCVIYTTMSTFSFVLSEVGQQYTQCYRFKIQPDSEQFVLVWLQSPLLEHVSQIARRFYSSSRWRDAVVQRENSPICIGFGNYTSSHVLLPSCVFHQLFCSQFLSLETSPRSLSEAIWFVWLWETSSPAGQFQPA